MQSPKPRSPGYLLRHANGVWYIHWVEGRRTKRESTWTKVEREAIDALAAWRQQRGIPEHTVTPPPALHALRVLGRSPLAVDADGTIEMLRHLSAEIPAASGVPARILKLALTMMLMDATPDQLCELCIAVGEAEFNRTWDVVQNLADEAGPFQRWTQRAAKQVAHGSSLFIQGTSEYRRTVLQLAALARRADVGRPTSVDRKRSGFRRG